MELIPIASLAPTLASPETRSIRGIVTLLWPYSSSTRSASLLLAEPDFRLRRNKGQVRVLLRGRSAEAVAKSRIGIGDEVILGLDGVRWIEGTDAEDTVSTPGKSVDWELRFGRRIVLQVCIFRHTIGSLHGH